MRIISIDIETYSSADLKKQGLAKYVEAPDFAILLFAYSIDDQPVELIDLTCQQLPEWLIVMLGDPNVLKVAFNAAFEWACLSKFFITPFEQWYCAMNHALYCGLPNSLFEVCEALNLPTDKRKLGVGGALIRTFCCPVKPTKANGRKTRIYPQDEPEKWELFKDYCKKDVIAEMTVYDKLKSFQIPMRERQFVQIDHAINLNGVYVDRELIEGAIYIDKISSDTLINEVIQLTGIVNPRSRDQLLLWLSREIGEEINTLTKDSVKQLLGRDTLDEVAERVLRIRQELAKTSVAKYTAIDRGLCEDGRLRGLVQYYGANRTGRYAGRQVQVQNLPKNFLEPLDVARELVKAENIEGVKLLFGNVPETLSQLLRTSFIAPRGKLLAVADFSAIEARVIAWVSGETWRQEVFKTHGKIYEASAAAMFNVPIESIAKGEVNYDLRAKGKVAELACGYQGSVGALKAMGADKMGLDDNQLQEIINAWREANPNIVSLWYGVQNKVIETIKTGKLNTFKGLTFRREIDYSTKVDFLTIELPSGRKLFYAYPRLGVNKWGGESIAYMGMNQTSKKWELIETYGGRLVENCIAEDTPVLTTKGWVEIQNLDSNTLVWDGIDWVEHKGVICKGVQKTIKAHGVELTPEHGILTEKGWVRASQSEGFNRAKVQLPNGYKVCWKRREKVSLGSTMRMWSNQNYASQRVFKKENKILWVYAERTNRKRNKKTWTRKTRHIRRVAVYGRPLSIANTPSLEKLRGKRPKGLQRVGGFGRNILGGHERWVQKGAYSGTRRQRIRLLQSELPLGYDERARQQQAYEHQGRIEIRYNHSSRTESIVGHWEHNNTLSNSAQLPKREAYRHTGLHKQVFDVLDCGPRNRFVVLGNAGPVIVHNCIQAIARDCLCVALRRVHEAGYKINFHVHDELICEVEHGEQDLKNICSIMAEPIEWASGLVLTASGFVGEYYKKEG